ncbi:DUF397 domain-containing protein [Actinomadura sp. 21ATH]|uniref:DUF397 domain-containing protein n=1 Tax=Actinomadura sp. 21ATH TaxID=1735444 RepID=UPI0035C1D667
MDVTPLHWRKASRSSNNGGNCVEIAPLPGAVAVRDSKDPEGPRLHLNRGDFRRFAAVIKRS